MTARIDFVFDRRSKVTGFDIARRAQYHRPVITLRQKGAASVAAIFILMLLAASFCLVPMDAQAQTTQCGRPGDAAPASQQTANCFLTTPTATTAQTVLSKLSSVFHLVSLPVVSLVVGSDIPERPASESPQTDHDLYLKFRTLRI